MKTALTINQYVDMAREVITLGIYSGNPVTKQEAVRWLDVLCGTAKTVVVHPDTDSMTNTEDSEVGESW